MHEGIVVLSERGSEHVWAPAQRAAVVSRRASRDKAPSGETEVGFQGKGVGLGLGYAGRRGGTSGSQHGHLTAGRGPWLGGVRGLLKQRETLCPDESGQQGDSVTQHAGGTRAGSPCVRQGSPTRRNQQDVRAGRSLRQGFGSCGYDSHEDSRPAICRVETHRSCWCSSSGPNPET